MTRASPGLARSQIRPTLHAVSALQVFYPEATGGGALVLEVEQGRDVDAAFVASVCGRFGVDAGAKYVLHAERTGVFVLVPYEHNDYQWVVRTFLRFYALHQHVVTRRLYPTDREVAPSCTAAWLHAVHPPEPAPDAPPAEAVAWNEARNQAKQWHVSEGAAKRWGGRDVVRALLPALRAGERFERDGRELVLDREQQRVFVREVVVVPAAPTVPGGGRPNGQHPPLSARFELSEAIDKIAVSLGLSPDVGTYAVVEAAADVARLREAFAKIRAAVGVAERAPIHEVVAVVERAASTRAPDVDQAVRELTSMLYLRDHKPYAHAWDALNALSPDLAKLASDDTEAAFDAAHGTEVADG